MLSLLVAVTTVIAVVANTLFVWPQAIRLVRSQDIAGVSPGTWTLSVVLFSVWAVFAGRTGYWALMIANVSCLIAALLVFVTGLRLGWEARWA